MSYLFLFHSRSASNSNFFKFQSLWNLLIYSLQFLCHLCLFNYFTPSIFQLKYFYFADCVNQFITFTLSLDYLMSLALLRLRLSYFYLELAINSILLHYYIRSAILIISCSEPNYLSHLPWNYKCSSVLFFSSSMSTRTLDF